MHRAALLLVPTNSDGRIARKSREKSLSLSLEKKIEAHCPFPFLPPARFSFPLFEEDDPIPYFVFF